MWHANTTSFMGREEGQYYSFLCVTKPSWTLAEVLVFFTFFFCFNVFSPCIDKVSFPIQHY